MNPFNNMFKKNKVIILYALGAYLLGFFLFFNGDHPKNEEKYVKEKVKTPPIKGELRPEISNRSQDNFVFFVKKLASNLSADDCEKMFDEMFDEMNKPASSPLISKKMQMLLEKWGKVAPKQALEKIKSTGGAQYWVLPVFRGWMEKSPENAVAFFNESQEPLIKKNNWLPLTIAGTWANYSPQKAWDWVQLPSNRQSFGNNYQYFKNEIVRALVDKHPEQISQFLGKFSEEDVDNNAYLLGEKWVTDHSEAREWLEKLPEKSKAKAEAGVIMGTSKGELNSIKSQLASFDEDKQKALFNELAEPMLEASRLDMKDRVDWIMDMTSDERYPANIQFYINKWLLEDWENSRKWVDSLPPGDKKERLLKLYHYHTRNNFYAE